MMTVGKYITSAICASQNSLGLAFYLANSEENRVYDSILYDI